MKIKKGVFMIPSNFPQPFLCGVLKHLPIADIASHARVCKAWKIVADSDPLWAFKCLKDLGITQSDPGFSFKNSYRLLSNNLSFTQFQVLDRKIILAWSNCLYFDLSSTYQQRGMQKDKIVSSDHAFNITCSHVEDNTKLVKLFTGSYDRSIKVWEINPDSGIFQHLQTLTKQQGMITTITSCANHLFSGSSDQTICVWSLNKERNEYALQQMLLGHEDAISAISVMDQGETPPLFSASKDKTILIWKNIEGAYELFQTLNSDAGVTCLEVIEDVDNRNRFISGDELGFVRIWEEQHNRLWSCIHTIQAHDCPISTIRYDRERKSFCTGGGKEAKLWELTKYGKDWESTKESLITDSIICDIKLGNFNNLVKENELYVRTEKELLVSWITEKGLALTDKTIVFPDEDMLE